jgi:hypothetical protein
MHACGCGFTHPDPDLVVRMEQWSSGVGGCPSSWQVRAMHAMEHARMHGLGSAPAITLGHQLVALGQDPLAVTGIPCVAWLAPAWDHASSMGTRSNHEARTHAWRVLWRGMPWVYGSGLLSMCMALGRASVHACMHPSMPWCFGTCMLLTPIQLRFCHVNGGL